MGEISVGTYVLALTLPLLLRRRRVGMCSPPLPSFLPLFLFILIDYRLPAFVFRCPFCAELLRGTAACTYRGTNLHSVRRRIAQRNSHKSISGLLFSSFFFLLPSFIRVKVQREQCRHVSRPGKTCRVVGRRRGPFVIATAASSSSSCLNRTTCKGRPSSIPLLPSAFPGSRYCKLCLNLRGRLKRRQGVQGQRTHPMRREGGAF